MYFSCMADTVGTFCGLSKTVSIVLCGFCLWALLNLRTRLFSDLNSVFVITLLGVVAVAIFSIKKIPESTSAEMHFRAIEWIHMVPIIFTAFGVQGSCAYFCSYLNNDLKRLKTAFLIGLAIPAVIYFLWTLCCLKTAMAYDTEFFRRLQEHQVSVGELIRFLCESSSVPAMRTFLKLLTILGVLTSIIGVALGLMQPLRSVLPKILTKPTLCFVPVIINLTLAEAFLKVLSFGGMMLAIFAILVPYQLLKPMGVQKTFAYRLCFIGGITVVACELWSVFC